MHAARSCAAVIAVIGATVLTLHLGGCAVARDQSTVGQFVDDAGITTQVKARFAESPVVSAMSINVETLKGTVQLSGFAKNEAERSEAEAIAGSVANVKGVRNDIVVQP